MDSYSPYSGRKYIVIAIFSFIMIVFIIKLFYIQIIDPKYRQSANDNVFRYVTQYPARGLIFDRNGKMLVFNQVAYDLMIQPDQLLAFDTLALCKILEIDPKVLVLEIKKAKKYSLHRASVIIKQISSLKYNVFQETLYKYPGFYFQTRTLRVYPSSIAAHVMGYIGEVDEAFIKKNSYYKSGDYLGISGIEKAYENDLRGIKGIKVLLVDVHNTVKGSYMNGALDTAAVVGANVFSSIDSTLQAYGEKLMMNKLGSVVAIEPSTGEILTLITSPSYDPNLMVGRTRAENYQKLRKDSLNPLFNRALMAKYPPGSTFKMLQALIGLQEGVITTQSVFNCAGGYHVGRTLKCHHFGGIGFLQSISGSCNAYYCHVFQRILDDKKFKRIGDAYTNWRNHVVSFGMGVKLETDLTHELKGILPSANYFDKKYGKDRWKSIWLISMAIGQGELGMTPLQMVNYTAILANRGFYYTPHIIKKVQGKEKIDARFLEKKVVSIDRQWFDPVIEGMRGVVTNGTAVIANVPDIEICGKTGTAQNPHGKDHSIFIAFAPKDNPKIAIAVYVENAGFGSTVAAPIASLMIEKYLRGSINRNDLEYRVLTMDMIHNSSPVIKILH